MAKPSTDPEMTVDCRTPPWDPRLDEAAPNSEEEVALARAREQLVGRSPDRVRVGRYRIVDRLGAGGMGVVYSAHDDELGRPVAVKVLRAEVGASAEHRQRLVREAQAMARLSHPNVVHVYEIGHHERSIFIAMELVRGVTLRRWLDAKHRSVEEILAMYLEAAQGLVAAHEAGLVHRDFKPDNVLVGDDGTPRVLDFGLARSGSDDAADPERASHVWPDDHDITVTGTVMGTPLYMAPEQLHGNKPDQRADQFAFCVALYEGLYGERPFTGSSLTTLAASIQRDRPNLGKRRPGISRRVATALRRGLSPAPDDRYPSMSALLDDLRPALLRRRGLRWAALGLVAAALAVAVALGAKPIDVAVTEVAAPSGDADDRWSAIIEASDLPAPLATPLPEDPAEVTIHRLDNGLTVYVAPRVGEASVQATIVVRADALDETPDQIGAAQLLRWLDGGERLGSTDPDAERPVLALRDAALQQLAASTDPARRKEWLARAVDAERAARRFGVVADHSRLLYDLGIGTGVLATLPGTQFGTTVPHNRLHQWAAVEAEAMRHQVFRVFLGRPGC
jgi:predicted Ser/Thr protein kinase